MRASIEDLQAQAAGLRDAVRRQWEDLKVLGMTERECHEAFHGADAAYEAFAAADYRNWEARRAANRNATPTPSEDAAG